MPDVLMPRIGTLRHWRRAAKRLMYDRIPPTEVNWHWDEGSVIEAELPPAPAMFRLRVTARFLELSQHAIWHSNPERFALLYDLLWRLRLSPKLSAQADDQTVAALAQMEAAVLKQERQIWQRLQFSARSGWLVAEIAPRFAVLEHMAPSLAERYSEFDWVIHSPDVTVRHRDGVLKIGEGVGALPIRKTPQLQTEQTPPLPGLFETSDYAPTCGGFSSVTPLILQP